MEMKIEDETKQSKEKLMALSAFTLVGPTSSTNPWGSPNNVDLMEMKDEDFHSLIKACRFFYKKDPLVASTINKFIEIGINELQMTKGSISENEFRIFTSMSDKLREFAEAMALEYLISGLVVPEIRYARVNKEQLKPFGIKKYTTLVLPTMMFVRDPQYIKLKRNPIGNQPSVFLRVPDDIIFFIKNKGKYGDGTEDRAMYEMFITYFPDFVRKILNNEIEFLIPGDMVIRRKPQPDSPYPVPYLTPALESLKHKRNLRRMDYAIASRVIGAIQLFKLGSDEFPVTEDDKDEQFNAIKEQIQWRDTGNKDLERIFQLFANHTLQVEWVVPDTAVLLDDKKYSSVNQDIIYALGFPRILITGESEKTGTSDPQYAMMSPSRTMEHFRSKIIQVIQQIVIRIADENNIANYPTVSFKPLTLFDHQTLLKSLSDLYAGGNISRTTYSNVLGMNWNDEMDLREEENKVLEQKKLDGFAPVPFNGQALDGDGGNGKRTDNPSKKPSDVNNTSNNSRGEN